MSTRPLIPLFVLLLATAAFGQLEKGSITGMVKDLAGAVVARAEVLATHLGTTQTFKALSSDDG